MAETDIYGDLFAIEVGTDDYAETAASDAPKVARTFQSEAAFQNIKDSYMAKIDIGDYREALFKAVPVLRTIDLAPLNGDSAPVKLGNKDKNLLGYAVGELYYDLKFTEVVDLCQRVEMACAIDCKLSESLEKWKARCEARMEGKQDDSVLARKRSH